MFGLMKRAERLSYCGSCKTIGAIYGQKARLLLNHDMVFLAELRMGEPEWTPAHKSFNCMAMPKEHPEALRYAAAATMVLSHFQIADHAADSGRRRWKAAQRFFSSSYRKAAADLRAAGFPLDELTQVLETQREREASALSIKDVAEPTARASEIVFGFGAPEFASIGRRFGYLIYVLDAWEDRARDAKSGEFNALLAFPEVDGRAEILAMVESLERHLPAALANRLRANVEERLGMRLRVFHGACKKSARDRWKSAVSFARSMKAKERAGILKGAAVVATVSVLAFFAPHQIRSAESWKQCFGVAMNLMAFGAVFATVPVPPAVPPAGGKPSGSGGTSWCSACGDCCNCCECCECAECCSCCDC
jgi:Family of unknown function (DUF5685)